MSDEAALLTAIREHPDEDTPRLAYADALDENGDSAKAERAAFIRAQIELARLPDDDARRTELEITERRLLAKNVVEWAAPWPEFQNWEYAGDGPWCALFRRGFLETVDTLGVTGSSFLDLCAAHPIGAKVWQPTANLASLVGALELNGIESLSLYSSITGRETTSHHREQFQQVDSFLRRAKLTRLRSLHVSLPGIPERDILHWFRLPLMRQLRSVAISAWMANTAPNGATVLELANGDFPNLRELHLGTGPNPDFGRALGRLVASDVWKRITRLSIDDGRGFPWTQALDAARLTHITARFGGDPNAVRTFANALTQTGPATLEELTLQGNHTHGENLSRILAAHGTSNMRRLNFIQSELTDDDLARIAESPVLGNLNRLVLSLHHSVRADLEPLFPNGNFENLTHLRVSGSVTTDAVRALAHNPTARRLRVLSLGTLSAPSVLAALTSGQVFPELHTVSFAFWRPSPDRAVIKEFLHSPKLPRLCVVPFSIDSNAVQNLSPVFQNCERIAWAGGEMGDGGDGMRVAVVPENVYLPNHLDDLPGQPW